MLSSIFVPLQYKLCRVRKLLLGPKGVPCVITHDGRTSFPDNTQLIDFKTGKSSYVKVDLGNLAMIDEAMGRSLSNRATMSIYMSRTAGNQFGGRIMGLPWSSTAMMNRINGGSKAYGFILIR